MRGLLERFNRKLNTHEGFFKSVFLLVRGNVLAQIITFIFLPILTRLYSPENYSVLAIYFSLVTILGSIACLRFEIAIPIVKRESEAKKLLHLSLLSSIVFFIFSMLVVFLSLDITSNIKLFNDIGYLIWLVPIGTFFYSIYNALVYWNTRNKYFKDIATTKVTQSLLGNITSTILGLSSLGPLGLIIGQIINFSSGIYRLRIKQKKSIKKSYFKELYITFLRNKKYPKYSVLESIANTGSIQLPIIIIGFYYLGPEAGYLMIAMRILGIPMTLIGASISQVYISNAPKQNDIYKYTLSICVKLTKIAIVPFLLLLITSPYIYTIILGENWSGIGKYIAMMIPWFFMQIICSPISMSLHIINKHKIALRLQIVGFIIRVLGTYLCALLFIDNLVIYYIFSGFVFYILYLSVVIYSLKKFKS